MTESKRRYERLCALFFEVIEHGGTDRRVALDRCCEGDDDVRRELERMLAAHDIEESRDKTRFLQTEWLQPFLEEPSSSHIPKSIGPYRVVSLVGSGGMGIVYRAEEEFPFRTVALKLIRPGFADERALRHFQREVAVLGRLTHPAIASIYSAGIEESPLGCLPYFAMEFVEGESLLDSCRRRGFGIHDRLRLFVAVIEGVHHAHQKGVIHRDLKPANILVTCDGLQPKILDFGIAISTDLDTMTSIALGTPAYMSPEQSMGDALDLDIRSDIYQLGVVLYELLTETLPYEVKGDSVSALLEEIREGRPVPLRHRDPSLRGDLETIVSKALAKDPDHRYQSASDFASDLRRFMSHQPIQARPQSLLYSLRKSVRRYRGLSLGVLTAFLGLVTALIVMNVARSREALAKEEANLRAKMASMRRVSPFPFRLGANSKN